jgi:hypothetical protein
VRLRYRVLVTVAVLIGCIAAFQLLTAISEGGEGPIAATLQRLSTAVGSAEHSIRERISGSSRAKDLAWFERYRVSTSLLRNPDSVLLGAYDSGIPATLEGVATLEQSLGVSLPLIQLYTAWGDKPDQQFPLRLVSAIWNFGSVPLLTWEPWLTDFENQRHPGIALRNVREKHGMAAVAAGDYDFYIDEWATQAARFGKPIFVRFGHEMNDAYRYPWGPQNNTKEEFIAAWQHVVDRFRKVNATNVIWVWSPHVAYKYWELYYPGDAYVDWAATGALNFGPIAQWSQWWSFDEIFGVRYKALAKFGKPIMIAEFGSLAVGGDRDAWYRSALANLPKRYPQVKAVLLFNVGTDQTVTYQKVDWTVNADSSVRRAITETVRPWAPGGQLRPRSR